MALFGMIHSQFGLSHGQTGPDLNADATYYNDYES